jgi:hypothetical protein
MMESATGDISPDQVPDEEAMATPAHSAEELAAATVLQASQRGRSVRAELRERRAAAQQIQAVHRGKASRTQTLAARQLEASVKRRLEMAERKLIEDAKENSAAAQIQAAQRGRIVRRPRKVEPEPEPEPTLPASPAKSKSNTAEEEQEPKVREKKFVSKPAGEVQTKSPKANRRTRLEEEKAAAREALKMAGIQGAHDGRRASYVVTDMPEVHHTAYVHEVPVIEEKREAKPIPEGGNLDMGINSVQQLLVELGEEEWTDKVVQHFILSDSQPITWMKQLEDMVADGSLQVRPHTQLPAASRP